jgi:hypothetical protein
MNVAVDEAWHEKSPSRINLPASRNWRTADGPDSATGNSDIVRSLKYSPTIEDSRVVNYEFARIIIAGFHLRALFRAVSLKILWLAWAWHREHRRPGSFETLHLQSHNDKCCNR